MDIDKLYLVYDIYESGYLHGALTFNDYNNVSNFGEAHYELYLTYMPHDESSLKSLKFTISSLGGSATGTIDYMNDTCGYLCWEYQGSFEARLGKNGIEFRIPWSSIPSYLPGRFISLESRWGEYSWNQQDYEKNSTNLKIGEVGTISGTVTYDGYKGDPLFVQAYTNPKKPDGSVVASTMITEPGPYALEGIGLGWNGYVRAFTPLFGFDNVFELEAFDIEASVPVFVWLENIQGVDITLSYPTVLEKDVWEPEEIDADIREVDWFAFDAVQGGTYTLDLTRGTADYACITLYGRDGDTEIEELYYWQTQQITWLCPVGGRYYIKVANGYYQPDGGTYQIRMTTDATCPDTDIASAEGIGVRDCKVDFHDLSALVSHWLDSCSSPYWCDDCDFNESGLVDFTDFANLANEWMVDNMP
jgi:hypothetical protein